MTAPDKVRESARLTADDLRARIREIPDFPKPGILFYDITTMLKDPAAFHESIDLMLEPYKDERIDIVVGMESRGFIFGSIVAQKLGAFDRDPGIRPQLRRFTAYAARWGADDCLPRYPESAHQD